MTLEDKQQHLIDLMNVTGNLAKLIRKMVTDTVTSMPEDQIDSLILSMDPEYDPEE